MKRTVLTFALACLTAAGLLAVGCGKKEKSPEPEKETAEARQPRPEGAPAPVATKKYPGKWVDAKVGTMVKMKQAGGYATTTHEVVKADADTVTIRMTMTVQGSAATMKPRERTVPRYETTDPLTRKPPAGTEIKKLADQTLTIAGKSLKCEVYQTVMSMGERKFTTRSYMCKDVPGWVVRVESDATGKMGVMMELIEFKK